MEYISVSELNKTDKSLSWNLFAKGLEYLEWKRLLNEQDIGIDLSNLSSVNPSGVVWINFIALYRYLKNRPLSLVLPSKENQVGYLKFMGFDLITNELAVNVVNITEFFTTMQYLTKDKLKIALKNHIIIQPKNFHRHFLHIRDSLELYLRDILYPEKETKSNYYPDEIQKIESVDEGTVLISSFCQIIYEILENIIQHGGFEKDNGIGLISLTPPQSWSGIYPLTFSDCGKGLVKTFIIELEENIDDPQIRKVLKDINSFPLNSKSYFKRILAYILLYGYFRPKKKYIGFYKILPFFSLYKTRLQLRTDHFFTEVDFSKESFYPFLINHKNPSIKWIESFIETPILFGYIPGTHLNIQLTLPKKREGIDKSKWKSLIHF